MNINQLFPGEFLKSSDIKGQRIMVTMEKITMEKVGDDGDKPVLHFVGKDKALVLNKTNANMIAYRHGPETETWMGQQIGLHVEPVQFGGKIVDAIRVILPPEQPMPEQPMPEQPMPEQPTEQPGMLGQAQATAHPGMQRPAESQDQFDEDIPF